MHLSAQCHKHLGNLYDVRLDGPVRMVAERAIITHKDCIPPQIMKVVVLDGDIGGAGHQAEMPLLCRWHWT